MKEKIIDKEDFGTLCICAIRYCQGRKTYMPTLVQGIVRKFLPDIETRDLNVMIEDCKFQKKMNLYGDETIDKPDWIKWERCLLDERERRNKNG